MVLCGSPRPSMPSKRAEADRLDGFGTPKVKRLLSFADGDLPEQAQSDASTCSPKRPSSLSPAMRLRRSSSVLSTCSVLSTKSWFEDGVAVEDAVPPDKALVKEAALTTEEPVILADVKPFSEQSRSDPAMVALLEQVRVLSEDCFDDDCLKGCSKRGGWKLTLLASRLETGPGAMLLAFLVYRLKPDQECLSVSKLAVPEDHRRLGYGQKLISWSIQHAKGLQDISRVGLSSLAAAVKFYQRLGFKKLFDLTPKDCQDDEEYFPGQVYMEFRIKKPRNRLGGGRPQRNQRSGR